jgi:hypothetical protein
VDDARIQALTAEVLADLRAPAGASAAGVASALEGRVAALEAAVRDLRGASAVAAVALLGPSGVTGQHPSLQLLGPPSGGGPCVLEPDKPCVSSGQCRTFGH